MLQMTRNGIKEAGAWAAKQIALPGYDVEKVAAATRENPRWIHFGAGNIFRGYIAALQQRLLNEGLWETGIIAAEGYDEEIIEKMYAPYDNLSLLVIMKADGSFEKQVIASVTEGLVARTGGAEWDRLAAVFENPGLQMASFTITEKGYSLRNMAGEYSPLALQDMENGPDAPQTLMAMVTALLYRRWQKGGAPISMVSMDNCSHNGDKLKAAVTEMAGKWAEKDFVDKAFCGYLSDEKKVAFPLSMIDKITPSPSPAVQELLAADGVQGMKAAVTAKNTNIAPFVNAEKAQYLVVEDKFPNGRPPLERVGVYFTGRETVDKVEKMKVCTCLNPLHTCLAVFGCLLGYRSIAAEMGDPALCGMVKLLGYTEGLPVVADPGILSPKAFIDEVLEERFPNPNVPDTPQRIAADTSQKVGIRYGETLKAYRAAEGLDPASLTGIPLTIAGWCRYLLGRDDEWKEMTCSPDPMLEELSGYLRDIRLGEQGDVHGALQPILSNATLFGSNLYELGLGEKIEGYFAEMIREPGAVRKTLERCLGK